MGKFYVVKMAKSPEYIIPGKSVNLRYTDIPERFTKVLRRLMKPMNIWVNQTIMRKSMEIIMSQ